MRILFIHADALSYRVISEAVPNPEPVSPERREATFSECLVAFTTVELADEENPVGAGEAAAREAEDLASKLNVETVVIYPYAHLSSSLASSSKALEALGAMEEALLRRGLKAHRAPFGWYKAFTLSCKGHPLSELSRTVSAGGVEKARGEVGPEELRGKLIVLTPLGEELELTQGTVELLKDHPALYRLALNELGVKEGRGAPPAHIKLMHKLGLVGYEPSSDVGHLRFYPRGALVKDLLEALANDLALKRLGAIKVETPLMYRLSQKAIAEQVARFRERDYRLKVGGEEFTLRFAGDFGLFSMMRDAQLSYRHLPLRVYELSKSFRLEQRGECVGLRRLRAFTMPDVHCFCRDLEQGMEEYAQLFKVYTELAESMEIEYAVAFRAVEEFYREHREWFVELVKYAKRPALIELLPERRHYWVVKHEYHFVDPQGGNAQLCTVQLDVEDSERYGIYYVDEYGERKGCIIVHSSMGSVERWVYAILEEAARRAKAKEPPMLPTWLSPTQVRLIPVSKEYADYALKVASALEEAGFRVDLDDRDESVPKKVRDAETEWVPYVVVLGKKEVEGGLLTVRIRRTREVRSMSAEELINTLAKEVEGKPRLPLYEPRRLSMRPRFTG
ncbi:MAG: threonine--tRNA ligase [Candidatus Nezhaarchaeota archaeon]|nr:threonine--tRNA ligase [Candidatus Nezhaarchaeota archaeon]